MINFRLMKEMKKTLFTLLMLTLVVLQMSAQRHVSLSTDASMDVYLPSLEKAIGRGVIICPGGGYSYLAIDSEGTDWAPYFTEQGYTVAVLSYRMPAGNAVKPLRDAEAAVRYLREKGETWRIKNGCIGIMGFSAGGHVASTLATHAEDDAHPDFQILFYPVITMEPSYTHMGSHDNLLGANADEEQEELYSNEKQVKETTPTYAANDGTVSPDNSKNYYAALLQQGIPAFIKEYPTGGHGFGFKTSFAYHDDVLAELSAWMQTLNDLLPDGIFSVENEKVTSQGSIYTLDGRFAGNTLQNLPKGLYVREGKKLLK